MGLSTALAIVLSLFFTAVTGVLLWLLKRRRQQSLFLRHGIPGPPPHIIWGNWQQLKEHRLQVFENWIQKYGKVFGYYQGEIPFIVLTDVDMIRDCFIKETNTFHDRPTLVLNVEPYISSLLGVEGAEWKKTRRVLNPIFTAAKIKMMSQIMAGCSEEMLGIVGRKFDGGEAVDMLQIAQGLSLDVISKCALAWKVNCQTNTTDPLLRAMHSVVDDAENTLIQYAIALPILRKIAEWIYPYASYYKITTKILDNVREVIEYRRSGKGSRTTDMLQLMLDAQAGKEAKATTSSKGDMLIEDRHLLSNSFLFLAAGFDTTALTLAFGAFLLAKYPEEQERVFNEIVSVFSEPDMELTYDGIQKLKRLDMLIAETMRLYPPVVLFVSRCCRQDTTIMGQFIPAGVNVLVPTWHVHHDPNLWPDPYRFDPERFANGRNTHHPAAYLPFGLGPRGCIGKRFALLEIKMAMCKIIRKYTFIPCDGTPEDVELVVNNIMINPKGGLKVRLQRR
ncbi:cytochrome P450 3A5-like [Ixodes scapularis]|uniref:cytochrome P450 3A5-like n=1 Tax=Ixodes scapularis TaxID=6945 RepID=UPI001A9E8B0A|nr:cytochrome P450 3A5-like [Ixodes scapularis]